MKTGPAAADSPGEIRRSHDLLQAVTRALEILGSARDPTAALTESFEHATRAFGAEKALLLRVRLRRPAGAGEHPRAGPGVRAGRGLREGPLGGGRQRLAHPPRDRDAARSQLVENSQFEGAHAAETASLRGRPHSVLCAPVSDPWTGSVAGRPLLPDRARAARLLAG